MLDAVFGPDGKLYCLDYGETWGANADSKLMVVSFTHGNLPHRRRGCETGQRSHAAKVNLSSAGTVDPDGDSAALKYEWRDAGVVL